MILALDCETQTYSKGSPYDSRNVMCNFGLYGIDYCNTFRIEHGDLPYGKALAEGFEMIKKAEKIVLFNAKFDLSWMRKYGLDYTNLSIWDCQLAHFIITNQTHPYPSLNEVASYYGLESKLDKIAEYWENGVQTTDIPYEELDEYLRQDIKLTYEIYEKQQEHLKEMPEKRRLLSLSMQDLIVLADIEWNGIKYDFILSEKKAEELSTNLKNIDEQIYEMFPIDGINWNSNDHLSAVLYGGLVKYPVREATQRVLKDGTVKHGERWGEAVVEMPRLVNPLPKTECAKEGYWKTSEDILRSLKTKGKAKKLIDLVLERSIIDKELSTYALGLPKLYKERHYTGEIIHGNFNMTVARTGRLSSSSPNLQNLSKPIKECFISRYGK